MQANIAAFGGDPSNVTLGGQSAGAIDTTANLISPAAAGLFQRAITQSAPIPNGFFHNSRDCIEPGQYLRCCRQTVRPPRVCVACRPHGSCSCRERPMQVPRYVNMASRSWMEPSYPSSRKLPGPLGLTTRCPSWEARLRTRRTFGLSITEYFSGPPQVALTAAQYMANNSPAVLAEYPLSNYGGNPTLAQDRVSTDSSSQMPALRVLNQQASTNTGFGVYGYDFTYQNAPYYFPQMPNALRSDGSFPASRLPHHRHSVRVPKVARRKFGGEFETKSPASHANCRAPRLPCLTRSWRRGRTSRRPAIRTDRDFPCGRCSHRARGRSSRRTSPTRLETAAQYSANYQCDFWATH